MSATLAAEYAPYFASASQGEGQALPIMDVGERRFNVHEVYLDEMDTKLKGASAKLLSKCVRRRELDA